MGSSDFKQLMIPIAFMLLFGVLAGSIPPAMFETTAKGYQVSVPEYFRGLDAGAYAIDLNFTVDDATFNLFTWGFQHYDFSMGNRYWRATTTNSRSQLYIGLRNYLVLILISVDYLTWRSPQGIDRGAFLSGSEMNLDYSEEENWIKYRLSHPTDVTIGFDALIGFNTSLYSSPKEALEDNELVVYVGMGLDDLYTSLNLWSIIGETLSFQSPDIPYPLNIIIPGIIWVMFGYALLIVFTKLIPGLG